MLNTLLLLELSTYIKTKDLKCIINFDTEFNTDVLIMKLAYIVYRPTYVLLCNEIISNNINTIL